MSIVRKFLDLSTTHLPFDLAVGDEWGAGRLDKIEGVVAYDHPHYGALLWVPDDPDEVASEFDVFPPQVLVIQKLARSLGCDYVLFDRDGPINEELPTWDW